MSGKRRRAEDDLRATSDAIVEDALRVANLERTKQKLAPADPEVVDLSSEVEDLTERMRRASSLERTLADEVEAEDDAQVH